jgi:hypothetical protein
VASPADRQREVLILGQRIVAEAAHLLHQWLPPCADRARHDGDAIQQCEGTPVEVLARYVLERLPPRHEVDAIPDLRVPGDGADVRIGERRDEPRDGVREEHRVRVQPDDNVPLRARDPEVQGARLAAVRLPVDRYTRLAGERLPRNLVRIVR